MTKSSLFIFVLAVLFSIVFNSCDWENKITVSGVITNTDNVPLKGVSVKVGDEIVVTSKNGSFLFEGLTTEGDFVKLIFEKKGYFSVSRIIKKDKNVNQLQVALIKNGKSSYGKNITKKIRNSKGGTVKLNDGSKIKFPKNSIANFTGRFKVKLAQFTPNEYVYSNILPGDGKLLGKDADGSEFLIYSYSMFIVELSDMKNNLLQLAENSAATFEFDIPKDILNQVPDQMAMFYYDEELGCWVEEGIADKKDNKYVGTVGHFSFWNIGLKAKETATVNGEVFDRNGRAIVGQNVRIDQVAAVTDENGYFEAKVIPSNEFKVGMNYKGFDIIMDAGPIEAGETQTIDLSVPPMTYITGIIVDCDNNPQKGQANLTWDKSEFSNLYTKNGKFELAIPSVVTKSTLTLTVGKFSIKQEVENLDEKAEVDLGNIVVCDTTKKELDEDETGEISIEGRYNLTGRSDGKSLVNYHYIILNKNGKYIEKYQPKNSGNYIGGNEGTWSVKGNELKLKSTGNITDIYSINGNTIKRESANGIIFTFKKQGGTDKKDNNKNNSKNTVHIRGNGIDKTLKFVKSDCFPYSNIATTVIRTYDEKNKHILELYFYGTKGTGSFIYDAYDMENGDDPSFLIGSIDGLSIRGEDDKSNFGKLEITKYNVGGKVEGNYEAIVKGYEIKGNFSLPLLQYREYK